jgi:hypothetical protein
LSTENVRVAVVVELPALSVAVADHVYVCPVVKVVVSTDAVHVPPPVFEPPTVWHVP